MSPANQILHATIYRLYYSLSISYYNCRPTALCDLSHATLARRRRRPLTGRRYGAQWLRCGAGDIIIYYGNLWDLGCNLWFLVSLREGANWHLWRTWRWRFIEHRRNGWGDREECFLRTPVIDTNRSFGTPKGDFGEPYGTVVMSFYLPFLDTSV